MLSCILPCFSTTTTKTANIPHVNGNVPNIIILSLRFVIFFSVARWQTYLVCWEIYNLLLCFRELCYELLGNKTKVTWLCVTSTSAGRLWFVQVGCKDGTNIQFVFEISNTRMFYCYSKICSCIYKRI